MNILFVCSEDLAGLGAPKRWVLSANAEVTSSSAMSIILLALPEAAEAAKLVSASGCDDVEGNTKCDLKAVVTSLVSARSIADSFERRLLSSPFGMIVDSD